MAAPVVMVPGVPPEGKKPGAELEPERPQHRSGWTGTCWGRAALDELTDEIERSGRGDRTTTLYRAALRAGSVSAAGELDELTAHVTLVSIGLAIGLAHRDAERQVTRGMARGKLSPAGPAPSPVVAGTGDARVAVLEWWEAVAADPKLRSRTGATDLKLLAGLALSALAVGSTRVQESYRELSELSGLGLATIHRRLPALTRYVKRRGGSRMSATARSTWQLVAQRAERNTPGVARRGYASGVFHIARTFPKRSGLSNPASSYWQGWATGWAVYVTLDVDDGLTAAELASATGLHVGSVRRILARFAGEGWAHRDERGRWRAAAEPAELEPAYDGLTDWRAERILRHQNERQVWRAYLSSAADEREKRRRERLQRAELEQESAA